jgi:hypothetical protein
MLAIFFLSATWTPAFAGVTITREKSKAQTKGASFAADPISSSVVSEN